MKKIIKKIIPLFLINGYHWLLTFLGALYYRFPSRKLVVIGITGTKGKSSTIFLTAKILEAAGFRVNWISSLSIKISDKEQLNPLHMTMPGRFFIQKAIAKAVKIGCDYFLIEVTSEGIKQHRHRFIDFDVAVFTNLAPEHIETHGGFENYKKAKGELFKSLKKSFYKTIEGIKIPKIIIANIDDDNCSYFFNFGADKKIGFGFNSKSDYLKLCNTAIIPSSGSSLFDSSLLGKFNLYNNLAAYAIGISQKLSKDLIKRTLAKINFIPGRMEEIKEGQKFRIFIDDAHTPDSFTQVFETVNSLKKTKSRIISVFGATGGGRDKWKRPAMGKIAAQYSDFIILTNDDPYDENPQKIIDDIFNGIKAAGFSRNNVFQIPERRLAIRKALELARENDLVIFLGMGSQITQIIGDKAIPWSDEEAVKEELSEKVK